MRDHTSSVLALAAVPCPHGQTLLATGSQDRTVRVWNPATGIAVSMLHVGVGVLAPCHLPSGRLAIGTTEGSSSEVVKALVSGLPG
ncbi:MAG: hypothetical protein ACRDR6_20645 [Pseudonocardiaceae bacterium]